MEFRSYLISKASTGPGQFIEILIDNSWEHPLRRPMSIAGTSPNKLAIIYKTFGCSTKRMTEKKTGEFLSITGPLGNTFSFPDNGMEAIIVGGGVGLAPVVWLKEECDRRKIRNSLILGARSAKEHFMVNSHPDKIYLTTDDGSLGDQGTVMGRLTRICESADHPVIYACGPEAMLHAIQAFSIRNNIPAQLSVESYMACGLGICQGCAIKKKYTGQAENSYQQKYSLVCIEGPVFNALEINFD